MREVLGCLNEDGVVGDQGEGDWQGRSDFVSEVRALLSLPRPDPLARADTQEDVSDSPVVDDDAVLGGDDGLRDRGVHARRALGEVALAYTAWADGRIAQKKAKRPQFRGSHDKKRRVKAGNEQGDVREEGARQTEERCTKTKANHLAWVMPIAGSS
jgi:hypothetical protein